MTNATKDRIEFLKTACATVSAIGVLVAACSLWLQKRVWEDYHARARSEKAITLLADLTKSLVPATRAAQKLESNLGDDKLSKLKNGESFSIASADVPLLDAAIGEFSPRVCTGHEYQLTPRESFTLRWQIASYLNAVEVVCQARKSGVVDTKIIDDELLGLYDKSNHFTFCENYRRMVDDKGPKHYPAIHHFLSQAFGDSAPIIPIGGKQRANQTVSTTANNGY